MEFAATKRLDLTTVPATPVDAFRCRVLGRVAEGWRVRQVKTFDTCYEVYGFDAKGERIEAFFNPRTFERLEDKPAAGQ